MNELFTPEERLELEDARAYYEQIILQEQFLKAVGVLSDGTYAALTVPTKWGV